LVLASTGTGYDSYALAIDNSHNLNIYDVTGNAPRIIIHNDGSTLFNNSVTIASTGNTALSLTSSFSGDKPWNILIDQFGRFNLFDVTNNRSVWWVDETGLFNIPAPMILNPQNLTMSATLFANLGTPVNGTIYFCGDCNIANPCTGGGSGAIAKRLAGIWVCN
jgi:hypothetical protein